jgi:30S ribosomal protein S31
MGFVSFPSGNRNLTASRQTSDEIVTHSVETANTKNQNARPADPRTFRGYDGEPRGIPTMGKGDRRSKRGKVFRGTFGKKRPRLKSGSAVKPVAAAAAATTQG